MGRSGPERARHIQFTNLQLMKDEAKKHGSCYFNSIYLIMFLQSDFTDAGEGQIHYLNTFMQTPVRLSCHDDVLLKKAI